MKKNKLIKFFVFFLIVIISFNSKQNITAQIILTNGTKTTLPYIDTIKKNLSDESNFFPDTADYKIAIVVYKIRNDMGLVSDDSLINSAVQLLNQYFYDANLNFHVFDIKIIDDYNYSNILSESIVNELTRLHSSSGTINLYIVDSILLQQQEYYGFTYYPIVRDSNYIFINKAYLEGNYLLNLMGSFLGLLPTHEIIGGMEFANGTNCDNSGDFLCDTYADPNLVGLVSPDSCSYLGYAADPLGKFYAPSVANFMSNSADICKCIFTKAQYKRIKYYYRNYRDYLR